MPSGKPYVYKLLDALDGADLTTTERSVLLAQFKFADTNGRNSYASEARLARYLSTSESTIRRSRKVLRTKGWLIERSRGHNGRDEDRASTYEVAIPPAIPAAQKPRRAPRNKEGYNGRKKKLEVTGDRKLQVNQTSNPSKLEVTGNHLPGTTVTGSDEPPYDVVEQQRLASTYGVPGGSSAESGTADAAREVAAAAVGVGDGVPGMAVVGRAKGSAELSSANDNPWGSPPPCSKCGAEFGSSQELRDHSRACRRDYDYDYDEDCL